ncbi:MAG TPA: hypothetical protein VMF06_13535 [Candidatus Limnocylindria bacterium]|nr:hypothetical protein [Candidatus Limnocylindria bacterium]
MPVSNLFRSVTLAILTLAWCSCRRESAATATDLAKAKAVSTKETREANEWFESHLINAYLQASGHDPQWDASITNAIRQIAALRSGKEHSARAQEAVGTSAGLAVSQGCKDPYVRYLRVRFQPQTASGDNSTSRSQEYPAIVSDMMANGYPSDMIFYACVRAAQALQGATNWISPEVWQLRNQALSEVTETLQSTKVPASEIRSECKEMLALVQRNPELRTEAWASLEPLLFTHWKNHSFAHVLKGEYHYNRAWEARGTGYANTVGEEGWKVFGEETKIAEESFREAWKIDNTDPETARWMIEICVCQSYPREEMERWFDRAMAADPSYGPAASTKLRYLEPKWGGSPEAMIGFGRECITNTRYQGIMIVTVVEAYQRLAGYQAKDPEALERFYTHPEVWRDVEAAYAEMARRDPEATWYHNNLAWYAWRCRQWPALERELGLLKEPNYSYFGGEEAFQKIVEASKAHASR